MSQEEACDLMDTVLSFLKKHLIPIGELQSEGSVPLCSVSRIFFFLVSISSFPSLWL